MQPSAGLQARMRHWCQAAYMLSETDVFVWEIAGTSTQDHLGDEQRDKLRRVLRHGHAPLRYAALGLCVCAYTLPFLLLEGPLREALAAQAVERAGLAIFILLGASTLVLSPLFGLLSHVRRESKVLIEAGRKFTATVLPGDGSTAVRLSLTTHEGPCLVVVPRPGVASYPGQQWMVYAIPEEANLAAVCVPGKTGDQLRIGHLERPASA